MDNYQQFNMVYKDQYFKYIIFKLPLLLANQTSEYHAQDKDHSKHIFVNLATVIFEYPTIVAK